MKTYKNYLNESNNEDKRLAYAITEMTTKIESLKKECATLEIKCSRRGYKASAASLKNVQGSLGKAADMCVAADEDFGL